MVELGGRRVTTHWAACDLFERMFPQITLERDPIFVRDGNLYSSAGVTAGMDLALALVEDDLGRAVALETARGLVLFLRRPGGQSQFSAQLAVQAGDREPLRDLVAWIVDHPGADLSVEALARRVAMSPRHFARVFTREIGTTPARYVEKVRVEAAPSTRSPMRAASGPARPCAGHSCARCAWRRAPTADASAPRSSTDPLEEDFA